MTDQAILASFSSALAGIVAKTAPAIVSVHSHRARASGFVWKPGLIVTADEALADEGEVSIKLADGTSRPASIVGRDHTTDIALLRFDATNIAPARLSPAVPALGSLAAVVAAERGTPSAALGVVSLVGGRWRSLRGGDIDARIELGIRLHHSHQGGLALDASGEAFGMAVLGPRRVLVIPTATIERVATKLETHGRIARGYLGVALQAVQGGAIVLGVEPESPAAAGGLIVGDVITALGGEQVEDAADVHAQLGSGSAGREIAVDVLRAGVPRRLRVTVGERPEDG